LAAAAHHTLVIAPEFNEILSTRCRWVLESGGRLLGPSLAAVQLTGDKLALSRHLRGRGVPTPQSHRFLPGEPLPEVRYPQVWKPRYGAGSQATFLVKNPSALGDCIRKARAEGWGGEGLLQPLVQGQPASVAFLAGRRGLIPLLPAAQHLSEDGRFRYRGGKVPLPGELARRALQAALRAVEIVPELRGYVGVDVVLGCAEDGSGDAVIEINPRPTTSYVGLRALAETNLAQAWLQVAVREEMPLIRWRTGLAHFSASGIVELRP
jgi:predicted ATP-grasp superfamily ATP-dependent carboligase